MRFISKNFLLQSAEAEELYHNYAASMPIIDYHCHLPPEQIAADKNFQNVTKIWIDGDHYKWRAMRTWGIDEKYITGDASDRKKFLKWAETVPNTMRNPLYHWTHLELKRYFGIDELLTPDNAEQIYDQCSKMLQQPDFSTQGLIKKMNVKTICTTDDPADALNHHKKLRESDFSTTVCPAFRPDNAYNFTDNTAFNAYVDRLEKASDESIQRLADLMRVLEQRIDYFHDAGCRLADHGLEKIPASTESLASIKGGFKKMRAGKSVGKSLQEGCTYYILFELAKMYHSRGWVQQYHLGALRNTNERMFQKLGPDTGFDSIGDFSQAQTLARFLNDLDSTDQLAKTILYNVNSTYNEVLATMIGNFNDGSVKGKMQFGSAWWFLDQKDGMEDQLNILSNMGLLSCFVGMLTDSRSFLSYTRHEYFRRVLCNLLGGDVARGLLPNNMPQLGQMVENICYYNAKNYFAFT